MEESMHHVAAKRKRYVLLALVLVAAGLAIIPLTLVTVFGPILGALLIVAGALMFWQSGQKGPPPPEGR